MYSVLLLNNGEGWATARPDIMFSCLFLNFNTCLLSYDNEMYGAVYYVIYLAWIDTLLGLILYYRDNLH